MVGKEGYGVYLGDNQIAVIQGSRMEMNQDVTLAKFGDWSFLVKFKAFKPLFPLDDPLFGSRWSHTERSI